MKLKINLFLHTAQCTVYIYVYRTKLAKAKRGIHNTEKLLSNSNEHRTFWKDGTTNVLLDSIGFIL